LIKTAINQASDWLIGKVIDWFIDWYSEKVIAFLSSTFVSTTINLPGSVFNPRIAGLQDSADCKQCLFAMPNQYLQINCVLGFNTMNTTVEIQFGNQLRYGTKKKDLKQYDTSAITTKEEYHMTAITCVVSDRTINVTETTSSSLYIISSFNFQMYLFNMIQFIFEMIKNNMILHEYIFHGFIVDRVKSLTHIIVDCI